MLTVEKRFTGTINCAGRPGHQGKLVDKEGPAAGLEVGPGEFVWREVGSRHVAWCPEGGLMLAIFQVPNKFFDRDGRVTDMGGNDWQSVWGHTGKGSPT